jgi:hypothetical protein
MQSVELIIGGEVLEMPEGTTIPLTLQAQNIGDLNEKLGSFSRSFVVPGTAKNRAILENAFTFQNTGRLPYRKLDAALRVNGLDTFLGTVIIENDGLGWHEIRLSFYTGNSPFFQTITNRPLRSICFKEAQHFWTSKVAADSRALTEKYEYPIIAWRDLPADISPTNVDCKRLLPCLPTTYVLEAIAADSGYQITGDLLQQDFFQRILWPYSAEKKFLRDTNFTHRNNWRTRNPNVVNFNMFTGGGAPAPAATIPLATFDANDVPINELDNCCKYPGVYSKPGSVEQYYVGTPDRIRWKFTLKFFFYIEVPLDPGSELLITRSDSNNFGLDAQSTATMLGPGGGAVYDGGYQPASTAWSVGGPSNPLPYNGQDGYQYEMTGEFLVNPHAPIGFKIYVNGDLFLENISLEMEFLEDRGTTEVDRTVVVDKAPYIDIDYTRGLVSPSTCLPNITVAAFLKMVSQMTASIILVNEADKEVEFFTVNQLQANIGLARDWSDKLVNIRLSNWSSRSTGFGQLTTFRYTNEEVLGAAFGGYDLPIDDQTLEPVKALVALPVSAPRSIERNGVDIAYIPRLDVTTGLPVVSNDTKQTVVIRVPYDGTITMPYAYTTNVGSFFEADPDLVNVGKFVDATFGGLSWADDLFQRYYLPIQKWVEAYKEVTCFIELTAVDVFNLDFRKPVYLKQFDAYFYIQKIYDWVPGKPTKVDLLKIQ